MVKRLHGQRSGPVPAARGRLTEEAIATLKSAWTKISPLVPSALALYPVAAVPPTPAAAESPGSSKRGVKLVTVAAALLRRRAMVC